MPYATGETPEVGDYVKNQWEQPGRVTRVHFAQDEEDLICIRWDDEGLKLLFFLCLRINASLQKNCVTCASHKPAACNRQLDSWGALYLVRGRQLLGHAPLVFAIASRTSGICIRISYPIAKRGYANITRFHGTSILNANRFAFMATTFKDQPSAHEALPQSLLWTWKSGMRKALSTILVTRPMLTGRAGDVAGEGFAKKRGSRVSVKCF